MSIHIAWDGMKTQKWNTTKIDHKEENISWLLRAYDDNRYNIFDIVGLKSTLRVIRMCGHHDK